MAEPLNFHLHPTAQKNQIAENQIRIKYPQKPLLLLLAIRHTLNNFPYKEMIHLYKQEAFSCHTLCHFLKNESIKMYKKMKGHIQLRSATHNPQKKQEMQNLSQC